MNPSIKKPVLLFFAMFFVAGMALGFMLQRKEAGTELGTIFYLLLFATGLLTGTFIITLRNELIKKKAGVN